MKISRATLKLNGKGKGIYICKAVKKAKLPA
jgi:hypothetical protein